ncbi:MAG TPA: hypothetical protein VH480_03715 [Streptosporangiaceae bacterium]|jgi:hypothetical protein
MSSAQERPTGTDTAGTAPSAGNGGATTSTSGYQRGAHRSSGYAETGEGRAVAVMGFTALAAVLMILSGLWSFFVGLTGVLKGSFFVSVTNYTFTYNIHNWGWTHLILGAVVFAAGVCLLLGMTWARVVGIVLAVISGIANFLFLPYYPLWAIVVIAIDVFIIWALASGTRRTVS